MATELQQAAAGYVMVFGPPDATVQSGTTGAGTTLAVMITGVSITKSAQRVKTQNTAGETVNITTFNRNDTATVTVRPIASTRADAITAAIAAPNPGDCLYAITKGSPATWTDTEFSAGSTGKEGSIVSVAKSADNCSHF